ncbi:MAG: fibro-slime domain-containing protein, partial [Planctomycetota bacterium]|nr:fibro-slime domain-containing protein [Planctomycetota bacterium]
AMPTIAPPAGLSPYIEDVLYQGNGTSTLSTDLHCKTFTLQNNRTLVIDGDLTILCDETFKLENHVELIIPDGSSLTVYIMKDSSFQNNIDTNVDSSDPYRLTIYNLGVSEFVVENNVQIYAELISPDAPIHVKNNGDFYGLFTGQTAILDNHSGFHMEVQSATDVCGNVLNDTLGAAGGASSAGVSSSASFDQWFHDELGINLSIAHTLRFVRDSLGVYEFSELDFYPLDDQLFGNEGNAHNNNFTFEATVSFQYESCVGLFFEMASADDAYLFIDGQLVIDLGGLMHSQRQVIDLDRLNLTDGGLYQVKIYYANRHSPNAELEIRTNVQMLVTNIPRALSGAFD